MYIFDYKDSIYYIAVEHIASIAISLYTPSSYPYKSATEESLWIVSIKYIGDNMDSFEFPTRSAATMLASSIREMHSAMFDARTGK
jgi:hypothetical protein